MERAAGFAHDDTAEMKLNKLDVLLRQSFTPREDAALFAEMLSLPNDGRYPTNDFTPEQRRQKTLEALTTQLGVLSRSNPVLMIFEDVHWIDPTSLEALGRTVDRVKTLLRAPDGYLPPRVRTAVDRKTLRYCAQHQPSWRPRNRCSYRPSHWQQVAAWEYQARHH
jgi:predicted ATPase